MLNSQPTDKNDSLFSNTKLTDEIVMLKQIKLGLLLEQDYNESDKATFALVMSSYNTGERGGTIPLNISIERDKYEKTQNSLHILNAVSPAFTCSMSLAKHIVENELSDLNE